MLQITALMDNQPGIGTNLAAEHGLSFLAQYNGRRILFDCGHTALFLDNAAALSLLPPAPDAVVLSHGHYDHAGGYPVLAEAGLAGKEVWTGPGFFQKKYSSVPSGLADRSPGFDRTYLCEKGILHRQVRDMEELFPGVYLVGDFARVTEEAVSPHFLRETEAGLVGDDFSDEICMAFALEDGLSVLVGCAHPGIVNMLLSIQERFQRPVRAVFGGIHLMGASDARIQGTLERLKSMGITRLGLSHCTGDAAMAAIREDNAFCCCPLHGGDSVFLK